MTSPRTDNNGDNVVAIHGTDNNKPDNDNDNNIPGQSVLLQGQMATASHRKGDHNGHKPQARWQ